MAKRKEQEEVLKMRKMGMSYSQIRNKIDVSKSTLSIWLKNKPLSSDQMIMLRDKNPTRIENFRNTMNKKREEKLSCSLNNAQQTIKSFDKRDKLIAGIFLYFGEGSKTTKGTTAVTNTNPALLKFFIEWLEMHGVERHKIKVKLYLYEDMNINKMVLFWCKKLKVSKNQIRGPYIKSNHRKNFSTKGQYGCGTCTVLYENVAMFNTTLMYLKYMEKTISEE